MKIDPNIKTEVKHSETKSAWNVVAKAPLGGKYKIARIPYNVINNIEIDARERKEAFDHAEYISWCFNNSTTFLSVKPCE